MKTLSIYTNKKPHGFTLIELLVVVSIIGLLSSVVLAGMNSARYAANDARRFSDLRQMEKALDTYYADNGRYPSTSGQWNSQCNTFTNVTAENAIVGASPSPAFIGTYIPVIPQDPNFNSGTLTSNCYAYNSNGTDYKLVDYLPSNSATTNARYANFVDPYYTYSLSHGGGFNFRWAVWSAGYAQQN